MREMSFFGEKLKNARIKKRITFRKLSELVGLSPSFLSELEKGIRQPPKEEEKIKNLAIVLGIDQDQLIKTNKGEK